MKIGKINFFEIIKNIIKFPFWYINEEQLQNKDEKLSKLSVLHFDISGNDSNEEQSPNKKLISITFLVFHFDKSVND